MSDIEICRLSDNHHSWASNLLKERWGSTRMVSRGRVFQADILPGFVAVSNGAPSGLVTYNLIDAECEIVTLDSILEKTGVGSGLIEAVKQVAIRHKCRRLWLITTNDNTAALRFYQKHGFKLKAVHPDAITRSRQLKPEIPEQGFDDIPIRDEIELEMTLQTKSE
jgi:GNAT superfamily N-acetyltransferase